MGGAINFPRGNFPAFVKPAFEKFSPAAGYFVLVIINIKFIFNQISNDEYNINKIFIEKQYNSNYICVILTMFISTGDSRKNKR